MSKIQIGDIVKTRDGMGLVTQAPKGFKTIEVSTWYSLGLYYGPSCKKVWPQWFFKFLRKVNWI